MIDYQPQIFTAVASALRAKRPGIVVTGELSDQVTKFPCVQIEESRNVPTEQDNGPDSLFAEIQYRVRVYSSKKNGKMAEARAILADVDLVLEPLNLRRKTFLAQNGLYNNSAYRIEATYEAAIGADGILYRR